MNRLSSCFRLFSIAILGATFAWQAAADDAVAPAGAPKIVVDSATFDFGAFETGASVDHVFTIRNEGNAPLELGNVKPSCGCTVAELATKKIEPGQATELSTTLKLPAHPGPIAKTIAIETNDPANARLILTLKGNATQDIQVEPYVLSIRDVGQDEKAVVNAEIFAAREEVTFKLLEATINSENFAVTTEAVEEGKRYRVSVATKPPMPAARAGATLTLTTDNAKYPKFDINVSAYFVGDLVVAPEALHLVPPQEGQAPFKRYILVRPGKVKEFKVLDVKTPDEAITVTITERQPGNFYIELDNIVSKDELDGKSVVITTDAERMPRIEIPFKIAHPVRPEEIQPAGAAPATAPVSPVQ